MARPTSRRSLRFEGLEDRQLLSTAAPNDDQQLALQLINMARTTPQVAAQWLSQNVGSDVKSTLKHYNVDVDSVMSTISSSRALPPVAWNADLADAAQGHSQDMADNGYQSHTGSDGSSSDDRIKASGYVAKSTGENAFAYANNVDNAMQSFLYDWGVADAGHRRNLLQPGVSAQDSFTDVGVGVVKTGIRPSANKIGPVVVTQDFASRSNAPAQIVGVVYSDDDKNSFYSMGEGKGGVEIDATNLDTGKTDSTKTWDSGGYQMPLSPGRYQVTASENDVVIKQASVSISNLNVAQNFVTSDPWDGRSVAAATASVKPVSAPVVATVKAAAVAAPASTPAPTPTPVVSTPAPSASVSIDSATPVAVTLSTPTVTPVVTSGKSAIFAPSDWKGPAVSISSAADVVATAVASEATAVKPPLADWTTWKAKAR